jgi:Cadherin domain
MDKRMSSTPTRFLRYSALFFLLALLWSSCDRNENEPEIADQEFYLDENSGKGTLIGAIQADDADEGQVLSFEIVEGDSKSAFSLDSKTGILSVNDSTQLDFEKNPSFDLLIAVSDNHAKDPLESSARIAIYLNDLNEHAPVMEAQTFQVNEDCSNGTLIGTLVATDGDPGQILSYKIESGNEDRAICLDSCSGEIFVDNPACFDFERKQTLVFMISVCDNDSKMPLKSFATLTITILDVSVYKVDLSGFVQKGPFINGSGITISELNAQLEPTGKVFITQTNNNAGEFAIRGMELESRYLHLKADGFYFNERSGELSEAQLSLNSIIDAGDSQVANINILTHLEKERLEYLVRNGSSFSAAKVQAREDVLGILSFPGGGPESFQELDISQGGDENAKLLAASVIFQGMHSTGEFSEQINEISTDILADGRLNSSELGSNLVNHTNLLDLVELRSNIEDRYSDVGVAATIADFEKYIQLFRDSSNFEFNSLVAYPEFSDYGENILYGNKVDFLSGPGTYSMAADLPVGNQLKIKLTGGYWGIYMMPDGPVNWEFTQFDDEHKSQVFTATASGSRCDLKIMFDFGYPIVPYDVRVEYFENSSDVPSRTKVIHIEMHPDFH